MIRLYKFCFIFGAAYDDICQHDWTELLYLLRSRSVGYRADRLTFLTNKTMKQEILDALKLKFPGVSDAILGRIADKLCKTVKKSDDVAAAVEEVTTQTLLESYGDSRATEATQTAVSNYEKKHGLKGGEKVSGGAPQSEPNGGEPAADDDADTPAWAKAIMQGQKALGERLATLEGGKIADIRKQKLLEAIKDAPEKFRQRTEKSYSRMSFKDDDEFAAYLEEITKDAEDEIADAAANGAVAGRPKGGASPTVKSGEPSDKEVDEVVEHLKI